MKGLSKGRYDETFAGEDVRVVVPDNIVPSQSRLVLHHG